MKKNVETMIKSNDVDQIKKAKELDKQADLWLVRTYYRLGRMFAVDLNYNTSLEWLNRANPGESGYHPHTVYRDKLIDYGTGTDVVPDVVEDK